MNKLNLHKIIPGIMLILETLAFTFGFMFLVKFADNINEKPYLGVWCILRLISIIVSLCNILRYYFIVSSSGDIDNYNYFIDVGNNMVRGLNLICTVWGWYIFAKLYKNKNEYSNPIPEQIWIWFNMMLWYDTTTLSFLCICLPICILIKTALD